MPKPKKPSIEAPPSPAVGAEGASGVLADQEHGPTILSVLATGGSVQDAYSLVMEREHGRFIASLIRVQRESGLKDGYIAKGVRDLVGKVPEAVLCDALLTEGIDPVHVLLHFYELAIGKNTEQLMYAGISANYLTWMDHLADRGLVPKAWASEYEVRSFGHGYSLDLRPLALKRLPEGVRFPSPVNFRGTPLLRIPDGFVSELHAEFGECKDLGEIGKDVVFRHGVDLAGTRITSIPNGTVMEGIVDLTEALIKALPEKGLDTDELDLYGCSSWDGRLPDSVRDETTLILDANRTPDVEAAHKETAIEWSVESYRSYCRGRLEGVGKGPKKSEDPSVDAGPMLQAIEATGVDRFGAIEMIRPADPKVAAQLWMEALRLVTIPRGTFTMGSPEDEEDRDDDEGPVHEVTIRRDFSMCAMPLTQGAWLALMGANPSHFQGDPGLPVEQVSWDDICGKDGFLERLNAATEGARPEGMVFRLPTEAEWEYACRAGASTAYSFGRDPKALPEHGWFDGNAESRTHPVGLKTPNAWGLFDMHGNVFEWCLDRFGDYSKKPETDPEGSSKGDSRVLRGGSWCLSPEDCRSAARRRRSPDLRYRRLGFRAVLGFPART